MIYNVYKNCSDQQFELLKTHLEKLKEKILRLYTKRLKHKSRFDDDDYLILNFSFNNENLFGSNLSIIFEDEQDSLTFGVSILKAVDIKSIRYFKRANIAQNLSIELLEKNIDFYINEAISAYDSWSKDDLLKAEKTDIL
jgi:hypothetical protein